MAGPTTHYDLIAWQEAMNLVEAVYRDTESFPSKERFCLTEHPSPITRHASSGLKAVGDPEDDEEEEEEKKKSEEDEDDEEDNGEEEEETWQVGGARSASARCAPKDEE